MAQTFGINISQVGVPKYQETKLEPLNSADLSRFFNMSMQQKEFAQKNELMKADTLFKTHEVLKNFNYLLKDAPDVEEDLNNIAKEMSSVKTPQESLEVLSKAAAFMTSPKAIRAVKQYQALQDTQKFIAENRDNFSPDALAELTQIMEAETSFGLGPNGERIVGDTERLKQKAFQLLGASGGNTLKEQIQQQQLELTKAYKESQIAINEEKKTQLQYANEARVRDEQAFNQLVQNPNYSDETKLLLTSLRAADPKLYAETIGALVMNQLIGNDAAVRKAILEAVQAREGRNPNKPSSGKGGVNPETVSAETNKIINSSSFVFKDNEGNTHTVDNLWNKDGSMDAKAKIAGSEKLMMGTPILDEKGQIVSYFDARPFGNKYIDINDKDIYDDAILGHGDYTSFIPELDQYNGYAVKQNGKPFSDNLSLMESYFIEPGSEVETELGKFKGYVIKKKKEEPGTIVKTEFIVDPTKSSSDEAVQQGFIKTNNPQLIRQFIKDNRSKGEAWLKNNIGYIKQGDNIPEFIIKNVAWSPLAQNINFDRQSIINATQDILNSKQRGAALYDQMPGQPGFPNDNLIPIDKVREDGYAKMPTNTAINLYKNIGAEYNTVFKLLGEKPDIKNPAAGEALRAINREYNDKLGLSVIPMAIAKLKQVGDARIEPEELLNLNPYLLSAIYNTIDVDSADRILLSGISEVTDHNEHRAYNSYHHSGNALDFTASNDKLKSNPNLTYIQAGAQLFNGIITELMLNDTQNNVSTPINILIEGPDEKAKTQIRKVYGIDELIKKYPGKNIIIRDKTTKSPHLHMELMMDRFVDYNKVPVNSASRNIITGPDSTKQSTEGLNDLNLR